jgi:arsenate reductase
MAEGYLKHFTGAEAEIYSAGTEAQGLNKLAVQVMREDGVDISGQSSKTIDELGLADFDFIITVCDKAREGCPFFPGNAIRLHRNFEDPAHATGNDEQILERFRKVRDEIKIFCREFSENLS